MLLTRGRGGSLPVEKEMNLMKRILVLLLASMMLFAFVACDDNTPTPAPHEHEFGEWTITKEATCTEEGVKTRTCKGCSETETEAIPAKGHNPDANGKCIACGKMIVSNGADFLKATMNEGEVIISLQDDITIDIAPWNRDTNDKSVFGTASTTSIVVEGNGHTITFHNTNSDWNAIYTKNEDAVLTIKNATIDNSGYNADNGPWNSHDITFDCNVVLDNVTATNAIAIGKNAEIRNSRISDANCTQDAYMLWIQATGQTVTIENCIISGKSSTGNENRAIKIADQYIDEPKAVTLNVSGTTFSSDSKAAVLVTNKAGATINWGGGNDISGVAADKVNAVWNDSARVDAMDYVEVSGCTKIQEE